MNRIFERRGAIGWVVLFALGVPLAGAAFAGTTSDGAAAQQILDSIAQTSDSSTQAVTRTPVDEAKHALARAQGARRAGDAHHAELLEGLGREWAETARDLARAVSVEADAGTLEMAAAEAGLGAERARALLEEAIARRGRAESALEKLSADAGAKSKAPKAAASAMSPTKGPK